MAINAENKTKIEKTRERRNEMQRARRAEFQPVDDATKITATDRGRLEIPRLPKIHKNGNPFNRNLIYMKLLESPTAAAHNAACKAAGLITGKEDFRRAAQKRWINLKEPGKGEEITLENQIVNELETAIQKGFAGTEASRSQGTLDTAVVLAEISTRYLEHLTEIAAGAEASNLGITEGEERKRVVSHFRWERDSATARAAKESAGYKCEVCAEQMGFKYGHDIGADYAEAHHKVPLSELKDWKVVTSAEGLVCVCANCHRMLHRLIAQGENDAVKNLKARVDKQKKSEGWKA